MSIQYYPLHDALYRLYISPKIKYRPTEMHFLCRPSARYQSQRAEFAMLPEELQIWQMTPEFIRSLDSIAQREFETLRQKLAEARVTVVESAVEVLGDNAEHWLLAPNRAFSGDTPLSRLDTESGAGRVLELIFAIEHSLYS